MPTNHPNPQKKKDDDEVFWVLAADDLFETRSMWDSPTFERPAADSPKTAQWNTNIWRRTVPWSVVQEAFAALQQGSGGETGGEAATAPSDHWSPDVLTTYLHIKSMQHAHRQTQPDRQTPLLVDMTRGVDADGLPMAAVLLAAIQVTADAQTGLEPENAPQVFYRLPPDAIAALDGHHHHTNHDAAWPRRCSGTCWTCTATNRFGLATCSSWSTCCRCTAGWTA